MKLNRNVEKRLFGANGFVGVAIIPLLNTYRYRWFGCPVHVQANAKHGRGMLSIYEMFAGLFSPQFSSMDDNNFEPFALGAYIAADSSKTYVLDGLVVTGEESSKPISIRGARYPHSNTVTCQNRMLCSVHIAAIKKLKPRRANRLEHSTLDNNYCLFILFYFFFPVKPLGFQYLMVLFKKFRHLFTLC